MIALTRSTRVVWIQILHVASDCDANFEGVPDSIYTESDNDGVRDGLKNGNGN